MKMLKITALLTLCTGFAAFAGGSLDNTPPRTEKARSDVYKGPIGTAVTGLGASMTHKGLQRYAEMCWIEKRNSGLYPVNDIRLAKKFYAGKSSVGIGCMALGMNLLYKWYNSNVRNSYYPMK